MNTRFWLLDPPSNQKLGVVAGDTKFEEATCQANDGHLRAGKRLGILSATIEPAGVKDFTWTWCHEVLASEHLLDVFLKHRVTGFEIQPARISFSKGTSAPPALYELIVTGWGGIASPAAGLTLAKSCPTCNYKEYVIANPSRLIDEGSWDRSDLFIVWPLPAFRFASDRLANIIREERVTGVKLLPASDIPFKLGNTATPGRLLDCMPASRAHRLGGPLGIN